MNSLHGCFSTKTPTQEKGRHNDKKQTRYFFCSDLSVVVMQIPLAPFEEKIKGRAVVNSLKWHKPLPPFVSTFGIIGLFFRIISG